MPAVSSSAGGPKTVVGPISSASVLSIFVAVNVLNYFDRGYVSTILDIIEDPDTLNMSETEAGLMGGAYMFGYVICSIVFSQVIKKHECFRIAAIGLSLWVLSLLICGLFANKYMLMIGRIGTGCGEAAYLVCAPPFLDTIAPAAKRSMYLGMFFAAIPMGYAAGYMGGGFLIEAEPFSKTRTFMFMFLVEGAAMVPFIVWFLTHRSADWLVNGKPFSFADEAQEELYINYDENVLVEGGQGSLNSSASVEDVLLSKQVTEVEYGDNSYAGDLNESSVVDVDKLHAPPSLADRLKTLFTTPLYVAIVIGYTGQTFVLGAFAMYAVQYVTDVFHMGADDAGFFVGLVTAGTGLIGSALGGIVLDKNVHKKYVAYARKHGDSSLVTDANNVAATFQPSFDSASEDYQTLEEDGVTVAEEAALVASLTEEVKTLIKVEAAMQWVFFNSMFAVPFAIVPFAFPSMVNFFVFLTLAEFCLFLTLSPINSSIMWVVPFDLAPLAVAMGIVCIHCGGDAISPTILGAWLGNNGHNWGPVMLGTSFVLIVPVIFFAYAYYRANNDLKMKTVQNVIRANMA